MNDLHGRSTFRDARLLLIETPGLGFRAGQNGPDLAEKTEPIASAGPGSKWPMGHREVLGARPP